MNAVDWTHPKVLVAHTKMAPKLVPYIDQEVPTLHGESIADLPEDVRGGVDVLIGYQFPPGALALLPNLRWLHLTGTGTDHLPAAGPAPGLLVTGSARVPVKSVAEYAVSALLMLLKDFSALSERPQQRPWYTSQASMLHGSTVLVVGAGRIGQAVVHRLAALGAHCVAVTRTGAVPVENAERTVGVDALIEATASADHVVCCLPGTAETANLVDKDVLAVLPPHAVLVNVGRASTVEDAALHEALRSGGLRGAFLDVHRVEPLPSDDPVWTVPNLVVSPHRAFAFPGEPAAVGQTFLDNLADLRADRLPRDVIAVNRDESDS
ncbi:NAD(P)-dependent oxidoreductase [Streptomyces sp. NPDC047009]|uniref:NAD(P)-dependent oxidoreductase n=1 Tax=unclassified Streptomyces TaxID=2593676 RepID=UPI0033E8E31E